MTSYYKVLAVAALIASIANCQVKPEPGALIGSVKVQSISNIFALFLPLTSQKTFDNQTFWLNQSMSGFGYKFELRNVYIDTISYGTNTIAYQPNDNTIR